MKYLIFAFAYTIIASVAFAQKPKTEELFEMDSPYLDTCKIAGRDSCGMHFYDCTSGMTYECQLNVRYKLKTVKSKE